MRRLAVLVLVTLAIPAAAWADGIVLNNADETRTIACTAELSEVVVNGSGNTITTTGTCAKLVLNASDNKVVSAGVGKIAVNGSGNRVTVEATDKIAVTGANNQVTWKKGLNVKKPKIANLGVNNTIKQAP